MAALDGETGNVDNVNQVAYARTMKSKTERFTPIAKGKPLSKTPQAAVRRVIRVAKAEHAWIDGVLRGIPGMR